VTSGEAASLPTSNRGGSETERVGVVLDWLAASLDLFSVLDASDGSEDRGALAADLDGVLGVCADSVATSVNRWLFGGLFQLGERGRGRFYAWRYSLTDPAGEHVGLLEFGGVHTLREDGTRTVRFELTGGGCRRYETSNGGDHAQRWSSLASLLGLCDARITRIDIAADDFAGRWPVAWAIERYNAGEFDRRGQRPKARLIDDMGNRTGKTFYVGSRASENQLRVYEKGREQGDRDSEWVRYEGEFHASTRRELPLEMLVDPAPYLVGAFPVLSFVDGIGERLRIATEEVLASCKRAVLHFRRQYGPMLNAMLHASGGDESTLARLVVGTARSSLPSWCPRPEDTAQLLAAILFAPVGQVEGADCTNSEESI
jgi:phage replication initiation protein